MLIEEIKEGDRPVIEEEKEEGEKSVVSSKVVLKAKEDDKELLTDGAGAGGGAGRFGVWDVKSIFVGVGGRALFYPTLLYNVVRNKVQAEFRWWDWIDEFVLLGAIPFRSDVDRLRKVGVSAVITLNEPHETLVPTSVYEDHGIRHLVLPTRDYLYAPSLSDICRAVDFINENASCGQSTYVHCKAGRGRSTTIVVCYLVKYKQMMPDAAYGYVKAIRPRVLLASAQWQAVEEFYRFNVLKTNALSQIARMTFTRPKFFVNPNVFALDDGSVVFITKADVSGYDGNVESSEAITKEMWADLSLIYRVRVAGEAALARLSCLWLRCNAAKKISCEELTGEVGGCSIGTKQAGGFTVGIRVY